MGEELYRNSTRPDKNGRKTARQIEIEKRRWRVDYDLVYDGGGSEWSGYYTAKWLAKVAAWLHVYLRSWGGDAVLFDQSKGE